MIFFELLPSYGTGAVWKERGLMSFLFGYIYLSLIPQHYNLIFFIST